MHRRAAHRYLTANMTNENLEETVMKLRPNEYCPSPLAFCCGASARRKNADFA